MSKPERTSTTDVPGTLRMTAFPPGPGPYDRWELTVEESGEVLERGAMPMDEAAVKAAVSLYRARFADETDQIIRHALTGGSNRVYRKHYVVSRGGPTEALLEAMCDDGRMVLFDDGKHFLRCFHVTEKGAASVGLYLP